MGQGRGSGGGAVYVISVAAELTGLHPQTLRTYERYGLVKPGRTGGGGRRYSDVDVALLRRIAELTADGIGIEGVRRILALEKRLEVAERRAQQLAQRVAAVEEAQRQSPPRATGNLPALPQPTPKQELVVWRRHPRGL